MISPSPTQSDVSLDETVQVAAITGGDPQTPLPVSADDTALLRILRDLAQYRQEHNAAPAMILVNPLTALEIVLATHNWNHIFDPTDMRTILLECLPGLPY